ncbi:MAG: hypothetical protein OEY36_07570 [Gammaproteobacteria bacterium]|nr:hypothetical protein [Gammaproteobacteria bacterium]
MTSRKYILSFLTTLMLLAAATPLSADNSLLEQYRSALIHFKAGKFTEAESLFSQSAGYQARIGQAVSAYRLRQHSKAMSLFMQSVLLADNDDQRYQALYNAATCGFVSGDYASAHHLFSDAIKYRPADKAAIQFIELSAYLDRLVLADIARNNAATKKKKSSEGKKTVSAIDFVFDDDINLRLEDNTSTESDNNNSASELVTDQQLLKRLIELGIEAAELNRSADKLLSYTDQAIADQFSSLAAFSYTSAVSIPALWKRIFELEQGFPASLETIETLPGVRPW